MLMKKLLCLVGALLAVLMVNAQKVDDSRPVSTNHPYSYINQEDLVKLEKMVPENARKAQPKAPRRQLARAGEDVDTVDYFVALQSTMRNYRFEPNGGDILTHDAGIAREGNKVTFHNLFGLFYYHCKMALVTVVDYLIFIINLESPGLPSAVRWLCYIQIPR